MDSKRLILKILDTVEWLSQFEDAEVNLESFVRGWFLGTPASELRRDNVVEFLAWAMYAMEEGMLPRAQRKDITDVVR